MLLVMSEPAVSAAESAAAPVVEKKAKRTKGLNRGLGPNQVRDGKGKIRTKLPEPAVPLTRDVEKNPVDVFRWVLSRPAEDDRTFEQRNHREWFADDRRGF